MKATSPSRPAMAATDRAPARLIAIAIGAYALAGCLLAAAANADAPEGTTPKSDTPATPATPEAGTAAEPPATKTAATPASTRKGFRKGTQRLTLFGGWQSGGLANDSDLITPPLTVDIARFRLNLDDHSVYGLRYGYQLDEHWGVELSLSRTNSSLSSGRPFDAVEAATIVSNANPPFDTPAAQQALLTRLAAHSGPYGLDVTFLDVGATYIFNPKSRWPVELDAGMGWADGKLAKDPAIFEQLAHSNPPDPEPGHPRDPYLIVNELADPTNGTGCPALDDRCLALHGKGGLTFYVGGGADAAFTDRIHLRLSLRAKFVNHVVDPGDTFVSEEATVGIAFLFGGK